MSKELYNPLESLNQKALRSEIRQDISCRLRLLNYKPNAILGLGILDGSFSVYKLEGQSGVNTPYSFTLTFVSDEFIQIEDIVDTDVQITLKDEVNPLVKKTIFGKIFKACEDGSVARKKLYEIHVVSPLHYLGLNNSYEIYHDKKASDIIVSIIQRYTQLLNIHIEVKLDLLTAPIKEYTTQYNQSDLDFILMLCEEEGYSLIIDYSSSNPYTITLCELNEHVSVNTFSSTCSFNHSKEFKATNYIQDYYDKDKPSLEYKIQAGSNISSLIFDNESTSQLRSDIKKHKFQDKLNLLDESYYKDLSRYTKIDSQRQYVQANIIRGTSQELNIQDSLCINLEDEQANKQIDSIILSMTYDCFFPNALDEYKQSVNKKEKHKLQYEVSFIAIPKDIVYKPELKTIKPRIHSVLSAKVSNGNSNTKDDANTIDVDSLGRIKVLFHFEQNQITSCYLRLSNLHSGDGYGIQFLPRVNQEVIVSFINGDPNCPIIIGTLHNNENKIPYNLPKEKTKSFIKTNSMPQYEDKIGYNELAFEDKAGEELLSLRAQKDYSLLVLNDESKEIQNNSKTIINNDKQETIKNDSLLTVGNNLNENIEFNHISSVQKEKISTIQEDYELHVLKDLNTIVKNDLKTIVNKNYTKRVKGTSLEYFEKDVKQKYLKSMYLQVSEDNKIDINKAYHMKANTIKYDANKTIELIAKKGISIKCGANVLTVDTSGIHIKSGSSNTSSSNGKAGSLSVEQVEILKPLYNKLKVISLSASISKQDDIKDVLTFSAIVQKYENDAWIETKELSATQTAQMQWHFIKNNDLDDKDILSDNKIDDSISISGLEMSVNLSKTNIYKYAHVHCFVVDPKKEAYANSTLIRYLEVQDIKYDYPKKQEGECTAILNVDEPRSEELDQIRWNIENKEVEKYNGKEIIKHNIKEEKVYEINFKAYIKGIPEDASNATLTYDEKGKIKAKKDKENKEEKEKQEKEKANLALLKKKKEEKKEEITKLYFSYNQPAKPSIHKEKEETINSIKLNGTLIPLGTKVNIVAHGTKGAKAKIEVLVNNKEFEFVKDDKGITQFDIIFDENGRFITEVTLRPKNTNTYKQVINKYTPSIGSSIKEEKIILKGEIKEGKYQSSLEVDDMNTVGLVHYQTYIKDAYIIDPKTQEVKAKLIAKQEGDDIVFFDENNQEIASTATSNISNTFSGMNNGLGGLAAGMRHVNGSFAMSNSKGVKIKHYRSSWQGNQYMKTYSMSEWGGRLSRGTLIISVVVGFVQIKSAYKQDKAELEEKGIKTTKFIDEIGQHTEQQVASTALGFAGGAISGLVIGVIAVPATGVLIGLGISFIIGGVIGWAFSEAGSKGVEVIQDIKGSTIINDYPLEDNQ